MPFDTACPECSARLRLDAPPPAGHPVECPKCGALFVPPRAKKRPVDDEDDAPRPKKKAEKTKTVAGMPVKRKVKKKQVNPVILVGSILLGFGALIGLGAGMLWILNKAGKAEEMLSYVPGECNWARGVNVSQLSKYPGYSGEVAKFVTPEVLEAAASLADAADQPADTFLDYVVIAKSMPDARRESTMYVFRSRKPVKIPDVNAAIGGSPTGAPTRGAKGVLVGATLYTPTPRLFVVVPRESGSLNSGVMGGKENSFAKTGLDATGSLCARGSIWLIGRSTGRLKEFVARTTALTGQDLPGLAKAGKEATTFGVWTTPGGGGVRCGVAMQCADTKAAADLIKEMKEGPYGKGDESEPTNQMKSSYPDVSDKKFFSEFMQWLYFRQRRECAYFVSTSTEDKVSKLLSRYNSPTLGLDGGPNNPNAAFQSPGGGRGGNEGPSRGGVGGIAPPSMAGPGGAGP